MSSSAGQLDVSKYYTQARPKGTKDYIMQQTMIRCKDPAKSLAFYCDVLGFNMVMHREFPQWEFNVYVRASNMGSGPSGTAGSHGFHKTLLSLLLRPRAFESPAVPRTNRPLGHPVRPRGTVEPLYEHARLH